MICGAVAFWKSVLVLFDEWWIVQFAVYAILINKSPKQAWSPRMKMGNFNMKLQDWNPEKRLYVCLKITSKN